MPICATLNRRNGSQVALSSSPNRDNVLGCQYQFETLCRNFQAQQHDYCQEALEDFLLSPKRNNLLVFEVYSTISGKQGHSQKYKNYKTDTKPYGLVIFLM